MKTHDFSIWAGVLLLAFLPGLIGIISPNLLTKNYVTIITSCGSLMTLVFIAGILLDVKEEWLTIKKYSVDLESTTKYYIMPWLSLIFVIDLVLIWIGNPNFTNTKFNDVVTILGSIVSTIFFYAIFAGKYEFSQTTVKKRK